MSSKLRFNFLKPLTTNTVIIKRVESWWTDVKTGQPDQIFGVIEAFKTDKNPKKVLLGIGLYRTDEGNPFILPSVARAEEVIRLKRMDHEYLPQNGLVEFTRLAASLVLGRDSKIMDNGLTLTVQSLGGSGALKLVATFLAEFYPACKVVHLPDPTWIIHNSILEKSGIRLKTYKYYDSETISLNFCGMCDDIKNMPEKAIILFHACAHNPTGIDPTQEQWKELSKLCLEKNLFVIFDLAYQGIVSGDMDNDAFAVRQFIQDGHKVAIAQSFSKNMGLYGERVGALTMITTSKEESARMMSQMKIVIRNIYSNPPLYGARIAYNILSSKPLRCQWVKDVQGISKRLVTVRQSLVDELTNLGSTRNWGHLINQTGMFSYTGLTEEQVSRLAKDHSVYMCANGRMSIGFLGSKNMKYVANAIHVVTK